MSFNKYGRLKPGVYFLEWDDFKRKFGTTSHRKRLISGLKTAVLQLKSAGCQTVYIDGSFVTTKVVPNDFDACWDATGVNPFLLDPIFRDFSNGRRAQKTKYKGELFPANNIADDKGTVFLDFFQTDKSNGEQKGIIAIDLRKSI
ncbi:hypothetical protein GLW07_21845 [Bacillus hwajinpoensis]|uniref:Uncharacterized protein n=1 Tax=Guptibacillus hwajinpoensis TaxID=208199 RepID=A0A845F5S9_9BACL|nr:hypothetical protein [Pseudalkalibacillus hwajinpoensis]